MTEADTGQLSPAEARRQLERASIWPQVNNRQVFRAFCEVDRAKFVSENRQDEAYIDAIVKFEGTTTSISQPSLVAKMIDHLDPVGRNKVLEIGAGSGYSAAVLSRCSKQVYTIDYDETLANNARCRLSELGYDNVQVKAGDGALGWPDNAPYDAIILTCGVRDLPSKLLEPDFRAYPYFRLYLRLRP